MLDAPRLFLFAPTSLFVLDAAMLLFFSNEGCMRRLIISIVNDRLTKADDHSIDRQIISQRDDLLLLLVR
jgi:hypothetical protein